MSKEFEARVDIERDRRYYRAFPIWTATGFLVVVVGVCFFIFTWNLPILANGGLNIPVVSNLFGRPPPPPIDGIAACPRPTGPIGLQPAFNDQEREIRELRRLAFRNDFFAQLELGRRYSNVRATDRNIDQPIEAAVWYAMALANPRGYAPLTRFARPWGPSRIQDCRDWERHVAYFALDHLLARMSNDEQTKVRNRVIYVLSTLNSEGLRTLGRIFDDQYGPFGEPADDPEALEALGRPLGGPPGSGCRSAVTLFPRNSVDAYLFNYLAMQTGDVYGYVTLKTFEHSAPERVSYGSFAEAKAKRWVPPYEFYPPDAPLSGVPNSDESHPPGDDIWTAALLRMPELPFIHVGRAFCYLGITNIVAVTPEQLGPRAVQTLQAMLGLPMDGVLSNRLMLRAIQYAAVNGSPQAQLTLAIMYMEGVGVPCDYARAFYWFAQADRQGSPDAKFAMSTFFARGVEGIADQDKAKAVVLRLASAMAGFQPTATRFQAMMAQVTFQPRPPIGPGPPIE